MDIRPVRKQIKISQKELAQKTHISESYLSMIENGERKPSVEVAKRIAAELGFEWTRFYE